ncbi:MAG: hypothetical protein A2075_17730 [Geobacteraceae bacterium GWC2_58_44]|nr:MAG: hypothetical protein A2075_17730 [Geobacteraceae bacterium GWC2_58_44]HBG04323.1 iron dicitrate transport regulator FecR [Geobacter sp.]
MIPSASRRFKSLLILLLLPLMLLTLTGAALAEVVGRLSRVEGAVDIMPGGQLPAVAAREGGSVQKGDFVRTKSNARAEITFNDGSVIKIAQRSRIDVGEYSASDRKLGLPRGKVQAIVVPAAAGSAPRSFEIRTPNAIAGVRGTSFYVYHQNNITGVAVTQGIVHTANLAMPSKGVTLVAGTGTTVTRRNAPTPPRPISERELNSHRDDVTPASTQGAATENGGAASGEPGNSSGSSSGDSSATTATTASSASEEGTPASGTLTSTDGAGIPSSTTDSSTFDTSGTDLLNPVYSASALDVSLEEGARPLPHIAVASLVPTLSTLDPSSPSTTITVTDARETEIDPPKHDSTPDPGPTPDSTPDSTSDPTPDPTPEPDPTPDPDPTPAEPAFISRLPGELMSRDEIIDPNSNLLTIISDSGFAATLSGTASLWTGSAQATLSGVYPALPLQQPNHYWFGRLFSNSTANHTTADGGAYFGYFGGMSLDGTGATETILNALYLDPDGKIGIMHGSLPGTITAGALSGTGTLTLTEMTPISPIDPGSLSANWWDSTNGSTIVELTGPALTQFGTDGVAGAGLETIPDGTSTSTATSGTAGPTAATSAAIDTATGLIDTATGLNTDFGGARNESEGFMMDANLNLTSSMSNRGDVLRLGYLRADPSFGIWTRESFGTYNDSASQFVLISNAQWGTLNTDSSFSTDHYIRIASVGDWQSGGSLSGIADGVWGELSTGSIKLLTGTLTGSSNPDTSSFGAVTVGSFINPSRFLADPSLAAELGFPTLKGPDSFTLSGTSAAGSVTIGDVSFYSRKANDPVSLWIAQNVSGSYTGELQQQRFSLMNGATSGSSTILGTMQISSVSPATGSGTWLGTISALGETGTSFRSEFDGIAAGSFNGTTFTGTAAGLSHPVTYFNAINGGSTTQLTRFLNGGVSSYGSIDGIMAGMSLWSSTPTLTSDFKAIGFFTPDEPLIETDFVMSAPILSKDLPSGTAMTADGGAYQGHLVAGVSTTGGAPGTPAIDGIMNALYIAPNGDAGVLHGNFSGNIDPESNLWMADGSIFPVMLANDTGGVTAATLNSGNVRTITTPFSTGGTFFVFSDTPSPLVSAPGEFTRSFITSTPDWGIGQFGLYAAYSAAPTANTAWSMDFAIVDTFPANTGLVGMMSGDSWDPATGKLRADTRAGWHDLLSAQQAATPMTGIFIGETVGTFNPVSLQAMTSGIWLETSKFLGLAATVEGQAALQKLNIPAVEVGKADFNGSNGNVNVTIKDLRFFAPISGGRPQVFATDNINGSYSVPFPTGSVNLVQVPDIGVATSGIAPTFSINQWDSANSKWSATLSYNGSTGVVAGNSNIQFMGTAAGRTSGGTSGTFTGTAAGVVR